MQKQIYGFTNKNIKIASSNSQMNQGEFVAVEKIETPGGKIMFDLISLNGGSVLGERGDFVISTLEYLISLATHEILMGEISRN